MPGGAGTRRLGGPGLVIAKQSRKLTKHSANAFEDVCTMKEGSGKGEGHVLNVAWLVWVIGSRSKSRYLAD